MTEAEELQLECVNFKDGERMPLRNTKRGENTSPGFEIKNLSPAAKTISITMDDIEHPIFGVYNHWLIWNLPAEKTIPEDIPAGKFVPALSNARQGIGYGRHKYAGPKPPKGKQHTYRFDIYVLDCELDLKDNTRKKHLVSAMESHILQHGWITGIFE